MDIWRMKNPDTFRSTWRRKNPTPIQCRLDFFLISFGLTGFVCGTDILPGYKSDHSAVSLNLDFKENQRGPGFWKLNCSLLRELDYVQNIKQCIAETYYKYQNENDTMILEMIKMEIRAKTMQI